jgi:hypothetical protein
MPDDDLPRLFQELERQLAAAQQASHTAMARPKAATENSSE